MRSTCVSAGRRWPHRHLEVTLQAVTTSGRDSVADTRSARGPPTSVLCCGAGRASRQRCWGQRSGCGGGEAPDHRSPSPTPSSLPGFSICAGGGSPRAHQGSAESPRSRNRSNRCPTCCSGQTDGLPQPARGRVRRVPLSGGFRGACCSAEGGPVLPSHLKSLGFRLCVWEPRGR